MFTFCYRCNNAKLIDIGVGSQSINETQTRSCNKLHSSVSIQTSPVKDNFNNDNDFIKSKENNNKTLLTDFDMFDNVDDINNKQHNSKRNNVFDSNVNIDFDELISISQMPQRNINDKDNNVIVNDDNSNDTNTVINETILANINKITFCQREFDSFKSNSSTNNPSEKNLKNISLNNDDRNSLSIRNSISKSSFINESSKCNETVVDINNSKSDISVNEIENSEPVVYKKSLLSKFKYPLTNYSNKVNRLSINKNTSNALDIKLSQCKGLSKVSFMFSSYLQCI